MQGPLAFVQQPNQPMPLRRQPQLRLQLQRLTLQMEFVAVAVGACAGGEVVEAVWAAKTTWQRHAFLAKLETAWGKLAAHAVGGGAPGAVHTDGSCL